MTCNLTETEELERWFGDNSGYLNENIRIVHDERLGLHFRTTAPLAPGTTVVSAPHTIAISYLNALADDAFPVYRQQKQQFTVEAIGFFYLMSQYVNRQRSFWKPYLDTLPGPETDFSQPLFFDNAEDIACLEGTNVWHTITARKEVYRKYYHDGITVLQNAGIDVLPYTWRLFQWSATMFGSRSFTSLALLSTGSKYRTTFKSAPDGSREEVLLDMSRDPIEDLNYAVLFPGLDAGNHSHEARVHWKFDPGCFSLQINDQIESGAEVFNNYGPKGNDELLLGYGFCIPDNPYDTVALTVKPPSPGLQRELRDVKPDHFAAEGVWNPEKATFRLKLPSSDLTDAKQIFYELPEPLLELLLYTLRSERDLPFQFVPQTMDYITSTNSSGARYMPHLARVIVQFLSRTLSKLQSARLPPSPQNYKQEQAAIYRDGQIKIIVATIAGLRAYVRSLVWSTVASHPRLPPDPSLVGLETLIDNLSALEMLDDAFLNGIEAVTNTRDIDQLRLAGWEEDVWVLLISYILLQPQEHNKWLRDILPEYIDIDASWEGSFRTVDSDDITQAESLLEVVSTAMSALPGSLWADDRWTTGFIACVGGRIFQHESFTVSVPDENGDENARLFVYLHFSRRI